MDAKLFIKDLANAYSNLANLKDWGWKFQNERPGKST